LRHFGRGVGLELDKVAEENTGKTPNRCSSKYTDCDKYIKPRKAGFGAKVAL